MTPILTVSAHSREQAYDLARAAAACFYGHENFRVIEQSATLDKLEQTVAGEFRDATFDVTFRAVENDEDEL